MLERLNPVFASFRSHDVKYVVIGGIAAVIHGVPRATFDLDILIEASPENAERLLKALREAGLGTADLITSDELLQQVITVFNDRVRVDVQTSTPGLEFSGARQRAEAIDYRGQQIIVVCREDLIASKKATARPIDLDDVRALEQSP